MSEAHRENQQDKTKSSEVTYYRVDPTSLVVSPHNERQHDTDPGERFIDDVRRNGVEEAIEVRPTDIDGHTYEIHTLDIGEWTSNTPRSTENGLLKADLIRSLSGETE